MRKILITLAIAVLFAVGWIASDDDTTPTTEANDEPAAVTTPTGSPTPGPQPLSNDSASAGQPATTEPEHGETANQASTNEPDNGQSASTSGLVEQVENLPIAEADRGGYDRDDFGDYDRDALLDASMSEHGCFLSLADDQCYDDASEVHVDHIVALSEAWISGLDTSDTDVIAEDLDNLWLLTASVNMSKSDDDPAEWLPDNGVCSYIAAYVEVKIEYELTVDRAEQDALAEAAADC